jgi:transposase
VIIALREVNDHESKAVDMSNNTQEIGAALLEEPDNATVIFDLPGLAVEHVEVEPGGLRRLHVRTVDPAARFCPECGVFSTSNKGACTTRPKDIPYGDRLWLVWGKNRWRCREAACPRGSFTESLPGIPSRARCTTRLRVTAGEAVAEQGRCVAEVADHYGLSWGSTHRAYEDFVDPVLAEALPLVTALGMDETRRGKKRFKVNPETEKPEVVADVFHTGFVDAAGCAGLLGHVEGRTAANVIEWLTGQPESWRDHITHVTIDLSASYAKAVGEALPDAQLVADNFHLVKLANDMVTKVRQRVIQQTYGRRGRKQDFLWRARRRLVTGQERLSEKSANRLEAGLAEAGEAGAEIRRAYLIKEQLRTLLALSKKHATRSQISAELTLLYTMCDDSGIAEARKLARTIDKWWPAIEAAITTGYSNARSEAYNRVAKTEARNAYGFRNPTNHRRRVRWACTRQYRRAQGKITRLPS